MYRPVHQTQGNAQNTSVRNVLFSDKNHNTLRTVLIQDFEERNGGLNETQIDRLSNTLNHYTAQVYQVQGEKPIQMLNKEILSATAKDFSQYMQRKELTKNKSSVKTVANDNLFQETSQRFERLTNERNEVKALPPPIPDFRISLSEDSPPPAELFEQAKKQREMEALRQIKPDVGLQSRIDSDSMFQNHQDSQNRNTQLALVQRQTVQRPVDNTLVVMPDRRELLIGAIGSFDSMSGQATSNPTIVKPTFESPNKIDLPQNYIVREEKTVSYREIENNLFIYSADRDWLRNNKENRYNFSVNFDPAANAQSFGPSLATQQKFKNIVRIELVKCVIAGEGLDVTIDAVSVVGDQTDVTTTTAYQDNVLNFPYISVRVAELENNNYGTDNFLDRAFGVLQYDGKWQSDKLIQICNKGFFAMIPKYLKCQKEFYPTPLSTLQKMTIDIRRPNGELISNTPDTFDIGGIIAPISGASTGTGSQFPFNITLSNSLYDSLDGSGNPYNLFINTTTYFSKFDMCKGDRIQISGYTYPENVLNDTTYGSVLRTFSAWVNRPEGHIIVNTCYSTNTTEVKDESNIVGYANFIIIQSRYDDPSTGSIRLNPFAANISSILNNFGVSLQTPCRLINLNKQLNLVFRIITREMDSLSQIRPDNNY